MYDSNSFDVIIVGGSYSGLAAGMALGRALRKVLIIDSGKPCNRQTPYSHNFITQDGVPPQEIAALAKQQVGQYDTISFCNDLAISGTRTGAAFEIQMASGRKVRADKLIFATGITDVLPDIPGYAECWGISVLHCPYCHGYEVRDKKTGILGNGEFGFEFSTLISNWTKDLTLFTNGKSTLTPKQTAKLASHHIKIAETEIEKLEHESGYVTSILFKDGTKFPVAAIYTRGDFHQKCSIPQALGCKVTEEGYIAVDNLQRTSVTGVFACGDNTNRIRTVANAVATGTTAGMMLNKEIVFEKF